MSAAAFEISGLGVAYDRKRVLEDVTLSVPRGTLVGVVGPNGGGKSTLVKAVLGLVRPYEGEVEVLGRRLDRRNRRLVGYVPQRDAVDRSFPVSALDVVLMGRIPSLRPFRRYGEKDYQLAREALETVRLAEKANVQIGELSGGQQQRVFLARALAQGAEVLLLDEPVSGVDIPSQKEFFELLRFLQQTGKTVVVTSHDLSAINERFDRALLLNRRVVAFGPPESVFTPKNLSEAYGGRLTMLRMGDATMAVEEGGPDRRG